MNFSNKPTYYTYTFNSSVYIGFTPLPPLQKMRDVRVALFLSLPLEKMNSSKRSYFPSYTTKMLTSSSASNLFRTLPLD